MKKEIMEITGVGLNMSTLKNEKGIVTGTATVYSLDVNGEDYYDDFDFYYEIETGFVNYSIDEDTFGDYLEKIDIELIDNLKTNYL